VWNDTQRDATTGALRARAERQQLGAKLKGRKPTGWKMIHGPWPDDLPRIAGNGCQERKMNLQLQTSESVTEHRPDLEQVRP